MHKQKTLKDIRLEHNLTQKQFAKELGYKSRDSIAKKESGDISLTIHDLRKLREKFRVDLNDLKL